MEQAPQHSWRSAPEWPVPAPPLWWTRGGKMAWRWEPWTVEGRRGMECGNQTAEPPLPKDPHLCPSRPANGGSYFRKPEGLEEGADPLPPWKRLQPPKRDQEAEHLLCGLPEREEPEAEGSTSGEEEEERPLPLSSDLDTARFDEIKEDCCT